MGAASFNASELAALRTIGKNDNYDIVFAMNIWILVLDGVFDLGLAALLDTFATANDLTSQAGFETAPLAVHRVGVRTRIHTNQGFSLHLEDAPDAPPDLILVPALGAKSPPAIDAALCRRDIADAQAFLRKHAAAGATIGSACTGTFILASAGLLDAHKATTTWWLGPLFRERFRQVALDESRMIVQSGRFITAGAALAHMDLALWVLRQRSPQLAALTARYLIVDPRPSQVSYAIPDHLAHSDPIVEKFETWARQRLAHRFALSAAACAVGTSERTLARRLQSVLGKSPLSYLQDLRVERALHLLQTTDGSIDSIAAQVGYADGVTLRNLLRRKTGHGIRELRARAECE